MKNTAYIILLLIVIAGCGGRNTSTSKDSEKSVINGSSVSDDSLA